MVTLELHSEVPSDSDSRAYDFIFYRCFSDSLSSSHILAYSWVNNLYSKAQIAEKIV
jgi:hypothetical protein